MTHAGEIMSDNNVAQCSESNCFCLASENEASFQIRSDLLQIENGRKNLSPGYVVPNLNNSYVLSNVRPKIGHLNADQQVQLTTLVEKYRTLFSDTCSRTNVIYHDVEVGETVTYQTCM